MPEQAILIVVGESAPVPASLLEQTLNEEKETDEKLTALSREINTQAIEEGPKEERTKPTQVRKMPKSE